MMQLRPSAERGQTRIDWLQSWHSFSFADYYDPDMMGFGPLRVINEDIVAGGAGFPMHPHKNMEIITLMLKGALAHKDSMGNGTTIRPLDVQRMSAGRGVLHSEFNPSETEAAHLLQIWILPKTRGAEPSYEQKSFDPAGRMGQFQLLAAEDGSEGAISLDQDVKLSVATLNEQDLTLPANPQRLYWVQIASGSITLNGAALTAGDGVALADVDTLTFTRPAAAEIVLFDMANT